MISLNREMTYVDAYVLDKEYKYQDTVREAINLVDYLVRQKHNDKALAIHITSKHFMKKYKLDYSKEFLWKVYRQRLAHVKNGKDKYKIYAIEKRMEGGPIDIKLCACGCGNPVTKYKNKYLSGHNMRNKPKKHNDTQAKYMRKCRNDKKNKVIPFER